MPACMGGGQVGFRFAPSEGDQRRPLAVCQSRMYARDQIKAGKGRSGRYRISVEWRLLNGAHSSAVAFISIGVSSGSPFCCNLYYENMFCIMSVLTFVVHIEVYWVLKLA